MASKERRTHLRHVIMADATVMLQGESFSCTATDVSISGIGIQSFKNIHQDEVARIIIKIPDEATLHCTAIWSHHKLIQHLDAYQIGFQIHMISYQGIVHDSADELEIMVQKIVNKYTPSEI